MWFVLKKIALNQYPYEYMYFIALLIGSVPLILLKASDTESMVIINNFWAATSILIVTILSVAYFGEVMTNYTKIATALIFVSIGLFILSENEKQKQRLLNAVTNN
jgi:cadmium resistance protein CadD (predicted permease)